MSKNGKKKFQLHNIRQFLLRRLVAVETLLLTLRGREIKEIQTPVVFPTHAVVVIVVFHCFTCLRFAYRFTCYFSKKQSREPKNVREYETPEFEITKARPAFAP